MRNIFLFCGGLFLLLSCTHSKCITSNSNSNFEAKVIYQSEYGGTGLEEHFLINSQKEFNTYWAETTMQPIKEAPSINFEKKMILIKNFKSQRSGGTVYDFKSIDCTENKITVNYSITSSDGMVTQAITNPLMIIVLDKINEPNIEFKKIQ